MSCIFTQMHAEVTVVNYSTTVELVGGVSFKFALIDRVEHHGASRGFGLVSRVT